MMVVQEWSVVIDGVTVDLLPQALDPLARAVVISLFTWRRARADDVLPDGVTRFGWWGDTLADGGDKIGSRLWLLCREVINQETMLRAKSYAEEALAWLVDDGVAASVVVSVSRSGLHTVALTAVITRADGTQRELLFDDLWSRLNG